MNSNSFLSHMRSSVRSAISRVGAMNCSTFLRANAAWLSARNRSWRGGAGGSHGAAAAAGASAALVALRRGEGFPITRRLHDVVVAGEDPEIAAVAPVTGILLAQDFVVRKGIGIDFRRIQIECFHHAARKSRLVLDVAKAIMAGETSHLTDDLGGRSR